jgi:ABC-type hemin transport system substrate-binding protein
LIALLCTFAIAGCDDASGSHPVRAAEARNEIRIVSLSPALTRIAVDLGLGEWIVGRTQFCTAVDPAIPVAGDHFLQDFETLVRLDPTHILIQPPRNEVPGPLAELARQKGWSVVTWRIDTIADVRAVVREMPGRLAASPSDVSTRLAGRAAELLRDIDESLAAPSPRADDGERRVLLIYSTEPVISVFGGATYLDEIVRALGWRNAADHLSGWGQLTLEDVVRIDPDAVIVIAQGAVPLDEALGSIAALDLRAVDQHQAAVLGHPEALLPSTSIVEIAAMLREILDAFEEKLE